MTQPRRRRLSRGTILVILLALAVLLGLGVGWAKCGLGRGGDGSDRGDDDTAARKRTEPPAAIDAAPPACALRVGSDGAVATEDGEPLTVDDAVDRCKAAAVVTLDIAGDAPFGAVDDLRKALEAAGLDVREP